MDETAVKVETQDEAPEAPKSAPKVKAPRPTSIAKPTKRPSAKRSKKKPTAKKRPRSTPDSKRPPKKSPSSKPDYSKRLSKKPAAKKTAKPKTRKPSSNRPAKPATRSKRLSRKGAGRNPKEWIMSVHIPTPLLAKLDRLIARLKQGENRGASRSSLAVSAIAKLVK